MQRKGLFRCCWPLLIHFCFSCFDKFYRNTHMSLLKKEAFPAWFNKERVVTRSCIFELTITITTSQRSGTPAMYDFVLNEVSLSYWKRITPDFVVELSSHTTQLLNITTTDKRVIIENLI